MPKFDPPDIDPVLTQEAQSVVNQAAAKMDTWLDQSFAQLEQQFEKQLTTLEAELKQQRESFIEQEQHQAMAFIQQLQSLQSTTQHLTPLDPDQKQVIDQLNTLVSQAQQELNTRNERWRKFGESAVSIAHNGVKTLIKGVL